MNVAIIGPGRIGFAHGEALNAIGHEISFVVNKDQNSTSTKVFRQRFPNARSLSNVDELIAHSALWDVVYLTCPTEFVLDYLKRLISINKPVFVEKPVALTSESLSDFDGNPQIWVGFNRRHYLSVRKFKELVEQDTPSLITVTIPERSSPPLSENAGLPSLVIENSIHVFDVLNFVFGGVSWSKADAFRSESESFMSISALGSSYTNQVPIVLSMCFDAPENFSISATSAKQRLELKPLEMLSVYSGMEVREPSEDVPIRSYSPVLKEQYLADVRPGAKPGFVEQATELTQYLQGRSHSRITASITDTLAALRSIESLARCIG